MSPDPASPGGSGASPSVSRPLRPSGFEMRSRKRVTGDRRWRKAARPSQLLLRDPQDLGEGPAADLLPLMAAQVPTRETRTPRKDPRTRRAPCHVRGTVTRGSVPSGKARPHGAGVGLGTAGGGDRGAGGGPSCGLCVTDMQSPVPTSQRPHCPGPEETRTPRPPLRTRTCPRTLEPEDARVPHTKHHGICLKRMRSLPNALRFILLLFFSP